MIEYSEQGTGQDFGSLVARTWGRMSGSSVWLEKQGIFFAVARVYFQDREFHSHLVISFLRVQAHAVDWEHLKNYTFSWRGQKITFPHTLSTVSPYAIGGLVYGPEDPRIALEHDVESAQPIVIFNMGTDSSSYERAMYVMKPFSNFTTKLRIENQQPRLKEKNWAPFLLPWHEDTRDI